MDGTQWALKDITWVNLLLGIWLIVGLFALGVARLSSVALTNNIIIGVLVLVMSWWVITAAAPPTGAAWFQVFCGLWLLASPFVLKYRQLRTVAGNDIVVGIIVIAVALAEARAVARGPRTLA
jgi:hypothetical protein